MCVYGIALYNDIALKGILSKNLTQKTFLFSFHSRKGLLKFFFSSVLGRQEEGKKTKNLEKKEQSSQFSILF